ANAVHIAAAGRKALRGAKTANERVERSLLAALSSSDRAKFVRMLATVVSHAEGSDDDESGRRRARRGRCSPIFMSRREPGRASGPASVFAASAAGALAGLDTARSGFALGKLKDSKVVAAAWGFGAAASAAGGRWAVWAAIKVEGSIRMRPAPSQNMVGKS